LIEAGLLRELNCTKHLTGITILDVQGMTEPQAIKILKKLPLKPCPSLPLTLYIQKLRIPKQLILFRSFFSVEKTEVSSKNLTRN